MYLPLWLVLWTFIGPLIAYLSIRNAAAIQTLPPLQALAFILLAGPVFIGISILGIILATFTPAKHEQD